ncbi:MAG: hypothetical protein H6895_10100 [Defluviimonas sp.]|uniref:hypothetical protein n=1 Tax=Albidovulum sp. TaxID=1872424 RepID=UPI002A3120E7|nr:hypothetical protein [Defluviimonas sp.]
MERLGLGMLAAALGTGVVALLLQALKAGRARSAVRAAYLDSCAALFSSPRIEPDGGGFPRLSGTYGGQTFDLRAVLDTLTFRKLPALWVLVTLPCPMPLRGTIDLMMRPTGMEPFSNFHVLPDQVATPPGFPGELAIRTDDRSALPPESLLRPYLDLFDDPQVKELVLSPRGLRITFLAEEANRARYLIFRDAEVGVTPLPPDRLKPHLDALLAMREGVLRVAPEPRKSLSR